MFLDAQGFPCSYMLSTSIVGPLEHQRKLGDCQLSHSKIPVRAQGWQENNYVLQELRKDNFNNFYAHLHKHIILVTEHRPAACVSERNKGHLLNEG